jgi:hypothetical protein
VPDLPIGAGSSLRDIHFISLTPQNWEQSINAIVKAITSPTKLLQDQNGRLHVLDAQEDTVVATLQRNRLSPYIASLLTKEVALGSSGQTSASDVPLGQAERKQAAREARAKFRAAFSSAAGSIIGARTDPFNILAQSRGLHDAAMFIEFRYCVTASDLASYDEACQAFRDVRERVQPGILDFYQQQTKGSSTGATASEIISAIEDLLTFAPF